MQAFNPVDDNATDATWGVSVKPEVSVFHDTGGFHFTGLTLLKSLLLWIFILMVCALCVGRYSKACIQTLCGSAPSWTRSPQVLYLIRDTSSHTDSNEEPTEVHTEICKPPAYPVALRMPRPMDSAAPTEMTDHPPYIQCTNAGPVQLQPSSGCTGHSAGVDSVEVDTTDSHLPTYEQAALLSSMVYNHQTHQFELVSGRDDYYSNSSVFRQSQ